MVENVWPWHSAWRRAQEPREEVVGEEVDNGLRVALTPVETIEVTPHQAAREFALRVL